MPQRPELRHLVGVPSGLPRLPAVDIEGWDLSGQPLTLHVSSPGRWTLLLFLGASCDGCLPFWTARGAAEFGLEPQDAVVVVTRGPRVERPRELAALTGGDSTATSAGVVMSDTAWPTYRVHGPPFFVLLDGVSVATEGVAMGVAQVAGDAARARRRPVRESDHFPSARR